MLKHVFLWLKVMAELLGRAALEWLQAQHWLWEPMPPPPPPLYRTESSQPSAQHPRAAAEFGRTELRWDEVDRKCYEHKLKIRAWYLAHGLWAVKPD
jgi:hypothetical protein